jgi:hypothetical protein
MTYAAHTPGPWRVVSDGISHWIEIEPNKIALIKANKADRDLIAAAPDLLKACLDALLVEQVMGDADSELARRLHAAIVKAQGELA